jgi:hypothetical protein
VLETKIQTTFNICSQGSEELLAMLLAQENAVDLKNRDDVGWKTNGSCQRQEFVSLHDLATGRH